jgi:hypothetical protein
MVINKTGAAVTAPLSLSGFSPAGEARAYRYSGADPTAIQRLGNVAVSAAGFSATYPANSITLLAIPGPETPIQVLPNHIYLPLTIK